MAESSLSKIISHVENLEHVLDNFKEGIIAHDLNRRIFFFNKQAEKITGYKKEEVLGRDCHQAFGAPFCGEHCSFCGTEPALNDYTEYTINMVTKSGKSRKVEMTVTMMKDEAKQNIGVLVSLNDVTDIFDLKLKAGKLTGFSNIVGQDSKMLRLFQQIKDVARYDYPVHIWGDTGTGKELVANAIHNESYRSGGPFVPINCGSLPEGLVESELFGHVKGAFSGAVRDKKGRFELADRGTIFLDEIGELSKNMQVKLLRFLQDGKFERVGGEKSISVDVKIISATNKDLKKEVLKKNFRKDLYYRINVIPIKLPTLRERKNDIPILIDHFLREAEKIHKLNVPEISRKALGLMMDYEWPGNVRELQNAIQFSIVKCNGNKILPEDLPMELAAGVDFRSSRGPSRKLDINIVRAALKKTGGNKAKAARYLGVGRATLYRFLNDSPETIT